MGIKEGEEVIDPIQLILYHLALAQQLSVGKFSFGKELEDGEKGEGGLILEGDDLEALMS
jgi:hypothetical protein